MAKQSRASARRVLRESIVKLVLPALSSRGFALFVKSKGSPPSWELHRLRADGGFDVISIGFEDGYRPLFDATINIVPSGNPLTAWGERRSPDKTSALDLPGKVDIASRVFKNRIVRALTRFWGIGWFGFKPREDATYNKRLADAACLEFIACLEQAERWWDVRELGPNLVEANVGAVLRDPKITSGGSPCDLQRPHD